MPSTDVVDDTYRSIVYCLGSMVKQKFFLFVYM